MSVIDEVVSDLETKITANQRAVETIFATAREEGRDLVDTEDATLDRLHQTNAQLNERLARATRDYGINNEAASRIELVRSATPVTYRTAGELLYDLLHARDDVDARSRVEKLQRSIDTSREPLRLRRAAEHLGLDKENTVAVAGGFNGLVVAPNVGAVLDPSPMGAPLFSALGPVPAVGATFQRPRIVDPNFDTGVGSGLQEKEEGPSKAWDILTEPLTLDVTRGYINVSELLLEMVASSLDMVVSHMNRRLEWALERTAITALGTTDTTIPLAAVADADAIFKAIADASVAVAQATKQWPTWIAIGAIAAGRLMALTDAAGRLLFPWLNPSNAPGTGGFTGPVNTVGGLTPIYTPGITDADMYVGNGASVEAYLRRFPIMQALEPALFGRQIGVAAASAFYHPITTESPDGGTTPAERSGVAHIDWA